MRRILAGLSRGSGATVFFFLRSRGGAALGAAATLATYGAIDRLGILPEPFESDTTSILQDRSDDRSQPRKPR